MGENLILKILESKENRRIRQTNLIDKYKNTLISFMLNIPGIEKDNKNYRRIHRESMDYILFKLGEKNINILYGESFNKSTGREGYIVVDKFAVDIKLLMIEIEEEHYLGRLFDIDVFDKDNHQISRKVLGIGERKCLICSKDARICMRERNHNIEEVLSWVNSQIQGYFDLTKNKECGNIDMKDFNKYKF